MVIDSFSTPEIKLGGENLAGTGESKTRVRSLLGSLSRGLCSVPFALTRLTEFLEQRTDKRILGKLWSAAHVQPPTAASRLRQSVYGIHPAF